MSQTPDQLKELGRIFTAVGNGAQWQFASTTRPETWHEPEPGFSPLRAAEIGYLLRVRPRALPPPPEGREWHRGAEFTEVDLPEGYRPLLAGEETQIGDEVCTCGYGPWIPNGGGGRVAWSLVARYRTKRPLPVEDPYAELKAAHAAGKVIEIFIEDDEYGPDRWSRKESAGWPLPPARYRVKPDSVPLGPEDVQPMSVLRNLRRYPQTAWINFTCVNASGVCMGDTGRSYAQLMSEDWEIKRPGEDWKPCHKEPT